MIRSYVYYENHLQYVHQWIFFLILFTFVKGGSCILMDHKHFDTRT